MADLEARKQRLRELREAREARERGGTQSAAAANAASPVHGSAAGTTASSPAPGSPHASPGRPSSAPQSLAVVRNVAEVNIVPPPPPEAFEKGTLTNFVYVSDEPPPAAADDKADKTAEQTPARQMSTMPAHVARSRPAAGEPFAFPPRPGVVSGAAALARWERVENRAAATMESTPFNDFVAKASLVLQRTSSSAADNAASLETVMGIQTADGGAADLLMPRTVFSDASTRDRIVTALCCQPGSSEFLAAAYGSAARDGSGTTGSGLVHVWSTRTPKAPVFSFHCDGDVSALTYSKFHPQLLIGATYNGRVVCWDLRQGSDPVAASFPVPESHTAPVVSACVVGTSNSSVLSTTSTDGHICSWQPDMPIVPSNASELATPAGVAVLPNAVAVPESDSTRIFAAATDGQLYEGTRGSQSRRLEMQSICTAGTAHTSAVTGIDCHPPHSNARIASMMLTSSLDWTCRLWFQASGGATPGAGAWSSQAVQFTDFVYDAKWSPANAAVFAAADGGGNVTLWNAAKSLDMPVATVRIADGGASANKIAWDSNGQFIVAGCSRGDITLCAAAPAVAATAAADANALASFVTREA